MGFGFAAWPSMSVCADRARPGWALKWFGAKTYTAGCVRGFVLTRARLCGSAPCHAACLERMCGALSVALLWGALCAILRLSRASTAPANLHFKAHASAFHDMPMSPQGGWAERASRRGVHAVRRAYRLMQGVGSCASLRCLWHAFSGCCRRRAL